MRKIIISLVLLVPALAWGAGEISSLTALGGAPATADLLEIVDTSATPPANGTNKKMTISNLFTSPAISSPAITTPSITTKEVDGHTDATNLAAADVSNTIVYNTGQGAADVTLNLPAAAAGYSALFCVGTTVAANKWRVRAAANDKIYLLAADGTPTAGSDNGYVGYSTTAKYPTIGNCFALWSFKTDNYDWIAKPIGNIVLTAE